jgi:hypothetical protein
VELEKALVLVHLHGLVVVHVLGLVWMTVLV